MNDIKFKLVAFLMAFSFVSLMSCSYIYDAKITALEKSIDKLDANYKKMTPEQIEEAIQNCNSQFDSLNENDSKLNKEQKKRIYNLKGRYDKMLIRICAYLEFENLLDSTGVEYIIEYIKGLIGASSTQSTLEM